MGRISENIQRTLTLPAYGINLSGAYVAPLTATGGGLAIAAATANQALTVASAGNFAYMTDLWIMPTALAAVANTFSVLDSSGGTVLFNLPLLTGLAVGSLVPIRFSVPIRTAVAGGQFFVSTTGAALTWAAWVNGYYDNSLGNA